MFHEESQEKHQELQSLLLEITDFSQNTVIIICDFAEHGFVGSWIEGAYNTTLVLKNAGDDRQKIHGTYCYNTMRLEGDLKQCGTIYEGRWTQGSNTKGSFRFKISQDGMEIRGPWNSEDVFGNVRSGLWVARRLLPNGKVAKSAAHQPPQVARRLLSNGKIIKITDLGSCG